MHENYFLRFLFIFLISTVSPLFSWSNEGNLYQVSLAEKIDSSSNIFTGRVISQYCEWNEDSSAILTISNVEIIKVFKGNFQGDTVEIITIGGQLDNEILVTSSLLKLYPNDYGLFFCNVNSNSLFEVYSSKQGFLKYEIGLAIAPFVNYEIELLEEEIILKTGDLPQIHSTYNPPNQIHALQPGSLAFSPQVITAGTGSQLTLTGIGFGTSGPDALNYVSFPNADYGGAPSYIAPAASGYISWTDTMIVVIVPSPAGSGPIKVSVDGIEEFSTENLVIPFAILNAGNGVIPVMNNTNGFGGSIWRLNTSMNSPLSRFTDAYNTWRCATGVNWSIQSPLSTYSTISMTDGYNLVKMGTVPAGVLGVTYNTYQSCNGVNWFVKDQDMVFKSGASWNYTSGPPSGFQIDFETVALHELGHAHLLGHIVESDVMYYALATGTMHQNLSFQNIEAGTYALNESEIQSPCPINPMIVNFPAGCAQIALTDGTMLPLSNPLNEQTCIGLSNLDVNFSNQGLDTINNLIINWSVNGVLQSPTIWSGVLGFNEYVNDFNIGVYNFQDSLYDVRIWLEQVNGQMEMMNSNDTVYYLFHSIPCYPNEVAVIDIGSINSNNCLTTENIVSGFVNSGTNTITSCWLYFSANGIVQDSIFWTGSLSPGDSVENLTIGSYSNFYPSVEFSAWTAFPNGVQDVFNPNDTTYYTVFPNPLNGVYTIGGTSPDFQTLNQAVVRLNTYGICGNVTLNVRNGNYTDRLKFDSIPSPNPIYFVTIQSESGNADDVHFNYFAGTYPTYSFLEFDSTRNVIIKNMSYHFDGAGYSEELIFIDNGAQNLTFDGLVLDLSDPDYLNNATGKKAIYIYGNVISGLRPCNDLKFSNNKIYYGAHALFFANGSQISLGFPSGFVFENNLVLGQNNESVYFSGGEGAVFKNNIFNSSNKYGSGNSTYSYKQFYMDQHQGSLEISGNLFQYSGDLEALKLVNCNSTAANPTKIYNNSIKSEVPSIYNALSITDCDYIDLIHNTIHSSGSTIFTSQAAALAISSTTNSVLTNNQIINANAPVCVIENGGYIGNYNNFYRESSFYLSIINGTYNSTLAMHQTNTGNDANSLNLNPNFMDSIYLIPENFAMDNLGTPVFSVTTDITGASRNPITPDIGAYEFNQYMYDIGVTGSSLNNSTVCPGSSIDLYADIHNYGSLNVDSFFVYVNVNNNVFDTVLITQNIGPGNSASIFAGNYLIPNLLENTISFETAFPNNVLDSLPLNDGETISIYNKLNGIYTIGDTASDFLTISGAVDYLNQNGVCGPVTFNIKNGIYSGSSVPSMTINSYTGMSIMNPVTFQSLSQDSSLVMINSSYDAFKLNGAQNINFYYLGFSPYGNNEPITFDSCSNINISNCQFINGNIHDNNGTSLNEYYDDILIENSRFSNSSIYLLPDSSNNISILNNKFYSSSMIDLSQVSNLLISNNEFTLQTQMTAIRLLDCKDFSITLNKINTANHGIWINGGSPINSENIIANNFIRAHDMLVYLQNTSDLYVINNNMYKYDQVVNSSGLSIYYCTNITFENNIVQSEDIKPLFNFNAGGFTSISSNRNIYFIGSDSLVVAGGTIYFSFNDWNLLGNDLLSYEANPNYITSSDLHLDNLFIANGNASVYPFVTNDIDGDVRDVNFPDIGADEFFIDSANYHNISLISIISPDTNNCNPTDSIFLLVKNNSYINIDSFLVETYLFDNLSDSIWIIQTIQPNDTILISTGSFSFNPNTLYSMGFHVTKPNNEIDDYELDNYEEIEYILFGGLSINEFSITDCSTDRQLAITQFPNSTILWSGGQTTNVITISAPGTYSVTVTNSYGCAQTASIIIN
jgi:hypothetical protein